MQNLQLTAKNICLLVVIVLGIELSIFVLLSGDPTTTVSALLSGVFAYFTGNKLRDPLEITSTRQAVISSLPALVLLIAGSIILASSTSSWALWLSITLGFMIGNRAKAAGLGERIVR